MNYKTFDIFKDKKHEEDPRIPKDLFPDTFCGLIVGPSASGKSTLIKNLLLEKQGFYKKFDLVLFLAPYNISDLDLKEDRLHNTLDIDWIYPRIDYFKQQKKVQKVLIIDDLISGIKSGNNPQLIDFFFNRRKIVPGVEINILLTTQQYKVFPNKFRSCLQFIIIFQIPFKQFDQIKEEYFYSNRNDLTAVIHSHFKKYKHNFIYIRLNPSHQIFLNLKKQYEFFIRSFTFFTIFCWAISFFYC